METEIPSQLVIGVATYAVESLPGVENFYHDMLVDKVSYYHIIEYHIARNKSPAISQIWIPNNVRYLLFFLGQGLINSTFRLR